MRTCTRAHLLVGAAVVDHDVGVHLDALLVEGGDEVAQVVRATVPGVEVPEVGGHVALRSAKVKGGIMTDDQ